MTVLIHRLIRESVCRWFASFGDRGESIFVEDKDREQILGTLRQACHKTGWKIHAWILMSNHYHWLVETPQPNLVQGMLWLQNARAIAW